jgi:acetyl-CoA carboxylase biotin carboxyl carrier protein
MTLDDIKQILEMVREHELAEFELEQEGVKLRIKKDADRFVVGPPAALPIVAGPAAVPEAGASPVSPAPGPAAPVPVPANESESPELAIVKAPLVGTFYRSSSPEAAPYVEIGTVVHRKDVLCIIEAMKLMNEILSEYEGEVVKVYVENGQPVQYGERLFAIKAT